MNDDERTVDERIARAARELYNAPPETPGDEMWSEIEGRLADSAADGAAEVVPIRRARDRRPRRLPWWIGVAAALLIGLALGRLTLTTDPAGPTVAEAPSPAPAGGPARADDLAAADDRPARDDPTAVDDLAAADDRATAEALAANQPAATDVPAAAEHEPTPSMDDRSGRASLPLLVATREHLSRSESFLTAVQADLAMGDADPQIEPWARSLLSRTRLLMGSPAARDPEIRRLLEDLELMLAQVAFGGAAEDPEEARILDEGLENGNLLYRLRSATDGSIGSIPARSLRVSSL